MQMFASHHSPKKAFVAKIKVNKKCNDSQLSYQQILQQQIIDGEEFLEKIKMSRGAKWNNIVIPSEIVEPKIDSSDCDIKIVGDAPSVATAISQEIATLNEELRNLTCMSDFTNKFKNIEHLISIQKNNIYTIFYEKPIIPKSTPMQTMKLEMFVIDGKRENMSLIQTACIARVEVELQLNKSGQSWAELNTIYTNPECRGLGIASAMIATEIEVIKNLQASLVAKGFMPISYMCGLIRNFDNSMQRETLDEIYHKFNMEIRGDHCCYVFEEANSFEHTKEEKTKK